MFKYITRAAAIIFFLLGLAGTVILIWFVYNAAVLPSLKQKWVQIPSPSEPLITLKVSDTGEIFAEGADGGLYQFSRFPEPAWIHTKETETVNSGATCRPITDSTYKSESMSGKVKATVSVDCGFAEQAIYWDINLLENGETWYFEKTSNSYVVIGLVMFLPVGLIIDGALYVLGLFFLGLEIIVTSIRKSKQAGNA